MNPGTFSPTALAFGNQAIGTTSAVKTISLKNYKASALAISSVVTTGDYAQTNNCGTSVAAGATCTISVTFKPVATGSRPGTVTANVGAGPSPSASLTGNGVAAFTVSPTTLAFGNQPVATPSTAQTVTITNNQTGAISITGIATTGDYSRTTTCGASLAAASSCTFSVTFTPTVPGIGTGTLSFTVGGVDQSVSLSGTGTAQTTVTPTSLTFASVVLNATSAASAVTVKNNTTVALAVSGVAVTGDFAQINTCGTSLAAGATCTFSVTFKPTALGARTGQLSFSVGTTGSQTIALTGTGVAAVAVAPASLTFANQANGTTSAGQVVTVKNNQATALAISGVSISANFSDTTTCTASLAAGASCTYTVTFIPAVVGSLTGSLSFTAGGAQNIALSGTSVAAVTVSPTALAFGNQATQTTSPSQTITVTNNQTTTLTGLSSSVTGTGFGRTTTCGSTLTVATHSCTISVTFSPTAMGPVTGNVTVNYTGSGSPQTVTLSGTGTNAVVLSPAVVDFGTQMLGMATAAQAITLNNAQNTALTISSIAIVGVTDFTQTNNCGASLAAKASCTISAVFKPTVASNRVATLSVTDNATGSPHTMSLTGTGAVALTIAPTALTFNAQLLNTTSAAQVVTVTNALATPVTVVTDDQRGLSAEQQLRLAGRGSFLHGECDLQAGGGGDTYRSVDDQSGGHSADVEPDGHRFEHGGGSEPDDAGLRQPGDVNGKRGEDGDADQQPDQRAGDYQYCNESGGLRAEQYVRHRAGGLVVVRDQRDVHAGGSGQPGGDADGDDRGKHAECEHERSGRGAGDVVPDIAGARHPGDRNDERGEDSVIDQQSVDGVADQQHYGGDELWRDG